MAVHDRAAATGETVAAAVLPARVHDAPARRTAVGRAIVVMPPPP
jgi:hypothetical protein